VQGARRAERILDPSPLSYSGLLPAEKETASWQTLWESGLSLSNGKLVFTRCRMKLKFSRTDAGLPASAKLRLDAWGDLVIRMQIIGFSLHSFYLEKVG